jgi:hypothetical protein
MKMMNLTISVRIRFSRTWEREHLAGTLCARPKMRPAQRILVDSSPASKMSARRWLRLQLARGGAIIATLIFNNSSGIGDQQ